MRTLALQLVLMAVSSGGLQLSDLFTHAEFDATVFIDCLGYEQLKMKSPAHLLRLIERKFDGVDAYLRRQDCFIAFYVREVMAMRGHVSRMWIHVEAMLAVFCPEEVGPATNRRLTTFTRQANASGIMVAYDYTMHGETAPLTARFAGQHLWTTSGWDQLLRFMAGSDSATVPCKVTDRGTSRWASSLGSGDLHSTRELKIFHQERLTMTGWDRSKAELTDDVFVGKEREYGALLNDLYGTAIEEGARSALPKMRVPQPKHKRTAPKRAAGNTKVRVNGCGQSMMVYACRSLRPPQVTKHAQHSRQPV
jgi:hypothetical protein